jgi:hypothetical protein
MHTSYLTFSVFWIAIGASALAQIINYFSTPAESRTCRRKIALWIGLTAVALSGTAGYMAAINWSELPKSSVGLRPGQLYNNGGFPTIVP